MDEYPGSQKPCPEDYGCLITKDVKAGKDDFFIRDCLTSATSDYACETVETQEGFVHTCSCSTELCNENFVAAGSTEEPGSPTTPTTGPTETTPDLSSSTESTRPTENTRPTEGSTHPDTDTTTTSVANTIYAGSLVLVIYLIWYARDQNWGVP